MAGEQGGTAGTGTGAPGGTGGNAPVGSGTPGAGGAGAGAAGAGAGGPTPPQPRVIPEDVLPAELKGRSEQEIKFILSNLANSVRTQGEELRRLKGAQPPSDGKDKGGKSKGEEKPVKPLEERILEDPRAAIQEVVEEMYGGVVTTLSEGVSDSALHAMRSSDPDFAEHEEDVLALLKEAGAPATKKNMELALNSVVGRKTRETKRLEAQARLNQDQPPVDKGAPPTPAELTGLEKEIFLSSGMSREEWDKYKKDEFEVKVPTGKKKEAANA